MRQSAVRAVTFDANGTLFHSPRLGEIYAQVLVRHGIGVSGAEARRTVELVWQEFSCAQGLGADRFAAHPGGARGWWYRFVDRVGEHLGTVPISSFAKAELFQRFAGAEAWEVYDEVPEVLERLRGFGVRLAVLSNWDERLPSLLRALGLAEFFEVVVFSAGVGVEKPGAAIFQAALAALDLPPRQVLHVGDRRLEDLEGARAVGMQSLLVGRGDRGGDLQDLRPLIDWVQERRRLLPRALERR